MEQRSQPASKAPFPNARPTARPHRQGQRAGPRRALEIDDPVVAASPHEGHEPSLTGSRFPSEGSLQPRVPPKDLDVFRPRDHVDGRAREAGRQGFHRSGGEDHVSQGRETHEEDPHSLPPRTRRYSATTASVMAAAVKAAARAWPAAANASRRPGSARRPRMARAREAGSPLATDGHASPATSRLPGRSETTTGIPSAMASLIAALDPSPSTLGTTATVSNLVSSRESVRNPVNRKRAARPSSRTRRSNSALSAPSPTTRNTASGVSGDHRGGGLEEDPVPLLRAEGAAAPHHGRVRRDPYLPEEILPVVSGDRPGHTRLVQCRVGGDDGPRRRHLSLNGGGDLVRHGHPSVRLAVLPAGEERPPEGIGHPSVADEARLRPESSHRRRDGRRAAVVGVQDRLSARVPPGFDEAARAVRTPGG